MLNRKLIEKLSSLNLDAEVGYECQSIARAHPDITGNYIDLSGERRVDKEKIGSTGIFVLVSEYEEVRNGNLEERTHGTEINAVFSKKEDAEKMGKWLIKTSEDLAKEDKWSMEADEESMAKGEYYGRRYTSYRIENFLIL